jgi:SAM-dependent methyltransferase
VPWADLAPNRGLVSALAGVCGGGRAIVIGCGLGDDAEHVASHSWAGAFDLVVEVFTLQVLTGAARRTAFARIAQLVAPGGRLLVIAGARDEHDDPGKMPWPLTRAEIESFREHGLSEHSIADVLDEEEDRGLVRRWLAWFTRMQASRPAPRGGGRW